MDTHLNIPDWGNRLIVFYHGSRQYNVHCLNGTVDIITHARAPGSLHTHVVRRRITAPVYRCLSFVSESFFRDGSSTLADLAAKYRLLHPNKVIERELIKLIIEGRRKAEQERSNRRQKLP